MEFVYARKAEKDLVSLPKALQLRIAKKLIYFAESENPLEFAETLTEFALGSYRFRVGDYRIIFDVIDEKIVILKICRRDQVYR